MARKRKGKTPSDRWGELQDGHRDLIPHVSAWWDDTSSFREVRIKARDDGTHLAIAKGYGPDGGEVVCFGSGYGVEGALMALDSSLQGGNWKVDKPWQA